MILLEMHLSILCLLISSFIFLTLFAVKKDNEWLKMFTISFLLFSISFLIFKKIFLMDYLMGIVNVEASITSSHIGLQIQYYNWLIPNIEESRLLYLPFYKFGTTASMVARHLK
jgi:hypothetical protein